MQRISIELLRQNDKGKMTVRYRWEIIWKEHVAEALVVERYGWQGDKSYAWAVNVNEIGGLINNRLVRFNYTTSDQLKVAAFETRPLLELDVMIRQWGEKNEPYTGFENTWADTTRKMKNRFSLPSRAATGPDYPTETTMAELGALANRYSFDFSMVTTPTNPGLEKAKVVSSVMAEPVQPEPEQARTASWGVW